MPDRPTGPSVPTAPRLVEATADRLAQRALAALPDVVGRADLAALAPPLGRLLEARLAAAVDQAAPPSPWIDGDRVTEARDAWREVAREAVRIPPAEREAEVRQAAYRALSHLIRPASTMAAVAFEGQAGPLPVAVALDRIRAFGPYPYLPQIAQRYAERKGLAHIDREGLERLLRRIDRRMVSAFGADDWLALLAPLLEWVAPTGRPAGSVPAGLLRPLFLAKGADDLHDALDEIDTVDAETLRALLTDALPAPQPTAAPQPPSPAPSPSERADAPAPPSTPDDTDAPDASAPRPPPDDDRQPDDATFDDPTPDDAPPEEHRPPVIGSRYGSLEFEPVESEVVGQPRPIPNVPQADERVVYEPADDEHADSPMEQVREAVAESVPEFMPVSAPPVPVLDVSPAAPPAEDAEPDEAVADAPPADDSDPDDEPLWVRLARERDAGAPPPTAEADGDTPLWKRFAQSDLAERLPDPEPPGTLADAFSVSADAASADAAVPPGSLDDLEARLLGPDAPERRDWFVAELFGGSADEYRRTLGAIDRAPTYTDATAIISADVLRRHSVSPYTDSAVAFIDAVQSGFERR